MTITPTTAELLARVRETGAAFQEAAETVGFHAGPIGIFGTAWPEGMAAEDEPLISCHGRLGHTEVQTAWLGDVRVFVSHDIPLDGLEPGPRHDADCPLHRCTAGEVHADHATVNGAGED